MVFLPPNGGFWSGLLRSFPLDAPDFTMEQLIPLAFGGRLAQLNNGHVRLLQWNAWTWCGLGKPRIGLHPLCPDFPPPFGGNIRPQRKAASMITAGIIIGSLWIAAALIFGLGLARSASRQMPHPLSDIRGAVSRRKSEWSRSVGEFECRYRRHSRSMMTMIGTRRFGQGHVANLHAPRRMRRSPSAEPEV